MQISQIMRMFQNLIDSFLFENLINFTVVAKSDPNFRVGIIGQPGAGKSSFVDKLYDGKCQPRPRIGIETDATDWAKERHSSFGSRYDGITFYDSPGYNTEAHPLMPFLVLYPYWSMNLIIIFVKNKFHEADEIMINAVRRSGRPYLLVRSYSDSLDMDERKNFLKDVTARTSLKENNVAFYSSKTREGLDVLKNLIEGKVLAQKESKKAS